jgi:CysZ protein
MKRLHEWARRFVQGAGLPLRALHLLARNPTTWPFIWAPVLLTAAGLIYGLTLGWKVSGALLGLLWHAPASGWFIVGLWQLVHVALYLLGVLFDTLALPQVLGAPLNDLLSARVEVITLGETEAGLGLKRLAREMWASAVASLVRLLRFGLIQALLLLLNLVPGGQAVYPVAAFVWSALWLAQQYLDLTMSRHLYSPAETRAALRGVRPLSLGFGLVLAGIFLVPLANLFLVPLGVASGSLLYCDLLREGKVLAPGSAQRQAPAS